MKPKENARPDGGRVRAKGKPKRSRQLDTCLAGLAQGPILHFFEGDRLAARIISGGKGALLFIADGNGLHQVGGIFPNRKCALAALGEVI